MSTLETEVVESIDEVNENQWDHVVANSDAGTVFHRTGWLRAIEDGLGYSPRHVVVRKKGNPVAVLPNFLSTVKLPVEFDPAGFEQLCSLTPGFGGPAIVGRTDDCLDHLFDAVDDICGWDTIVHRLRIRNATHVRYAQQLERRGYTPSLLYCRFWLALDDYDRIWESMDRSRRREIERARDHDPTVERASLSGETLDRFYREYEKTIDRVDGTLYPRSFFRALADQLGDRVELFTAYIDGAAAGHHLCLRDDEQGSLHYFFAGVDEAYFEYATPAVIHDHCIKWAIENGYDSYDFGATSADHTDGTFNYKRKFGARIEPVYEWESGRAAVRWTAYRKGRERFLRRRAASH